MAAAEKGEGESQQASGGGGGCAQGGHHGSVHLGIVRLGSGVDVSPPLSQLRHRSKAADDLARFVIVALALAEDFKQEVQTWLPAEDCVRCEAAPLVIRAVFCGYSS